MHSRSEQADSTAVVDSASATGGMPPRRRPRPLPPKLYRVGELATYCGVSRQTIHNYTTMGIIREARWTRGGHRLYAEGVFDRLDEIADLKADGKTMEDLREHFRRMDQTPTPAGD